VRVGGKIGKSRLADNISSRSQQIGNLLHESTLRSQLCLIRSSQFGDVGFGLSRPLLRLGDLLITCTDVPFLLDLFLLRKSNSYE
jgi:hypothetical protein